MRRGNGIALEYRLPASASWADAVLLGRGNGSPTAVILELKALRKLEPAHEAQLLNLLRGTQLEVGLLLNFGPKAEIKRLVFSNDRKRGRGGQSSDLRSSA